MAKKRVKSIDQGNDQIDPVKFLESLNVLAGEDQEEAVPDFSGTANNEQVQETVDFPQVPNNPELLAQESQQELPQGLELLSEVAGLEAEEDIIDAPPESQQMMKKSFSPPELFPEQQQQQAPFTPPELYQPQDGQDEMQGLPPGLEFLADYQGLENQEDATDSAPEINPLEPKETENEKSLWESLGATNAWNPFNQGEREKQTKNLERIREDVDLKPLADEQGVSVDEYRRRNSEQYKQDQQRMSAEVAKALQEPYSTAVYGATDQVMNSPELMSEAERIGIEITPEQKEYAEKMELALSDQTDEELKTLGLYDDQVKGIRDRIDSNQVTDNDKYIAGLALIMPLIIGGLFGSEAAIGALKGSADAMMKIYDKRDKDIRADEEKLKELTKLQGESRRNLSELELKKLQIPSQAKKMVGASPYEHLKGMKKVKFTDEDGNEQEGVEFSPGVVAKMDYLDDKEAKTAMRKKGEEVNKNRDAINKLGDNSRKIVEIASQIPDSGFLSKIFQVWSKGKSPTLVKQFGTDIMVDGRKVNSAVALTQALEDTLEARRNVMKIKNFGPQLFEHFERILTNPYANFTSPEDLTNQTITLYTDSRDQFLNSVENQGFIKEAMVDDFYGKDLQMYNLLNQKQSMQKEANDEKRRMTEKVDVPNA